LADYRDNYDRIRAAGAELVAISVDSPEQSESLRKQLALPFLILCDTERRLIREWDIYNPRERGGIAKPAIFIVGTDRRIRYVSIDSVSVRVPALEIVRMLQTSQISSVKRKRYIPRPADWIRALGNALRR
jgi:peroxiredoxin